MFCPASAADNKWQYDKIKNCPLTLRSANNQIARTQDAAAKRSHVLPRSNYPIVVLDARLWVEILRFAPQRGSK
jgi:hypothetical protein